MSKQILNYVHYNFQHKQPINQVKFSIRSFSILQTRYAKKKDEELVKMSIGARRDLEDKMRIERATLKEALSNQKQREIEAAVDRKKVVRHSRLEYLLTLKKSIQCP